MVRNSISLCPWNSKPRRLMSFPSGSLIEPEEDPGLGEEVVATEDAERDVTTGCDYPPRTGISTVRLFTGLVLVIDVWPEDESPSQADRAHDATDDQILLGGRDDGVADALPEVVDDV